MTSLRKSKTISISINVPATKAYAFAVDARNLPQWIPSFCNSIQKTQDDWIMETPLGSASIRFVALNPFGVLDHVVNASGVEFYNPMRVIPNGDGCEVIFTLFHSPDMSEEQHQRDAKHVESDLRRLKEILEKAIA